MNPISRYPSAPAPAPEEEMAVPASNRKLMLMLLILLIAVTVLAQGLGDKALDAPQITNPQDCIAAGWVWESNGVYDGYCVGAVSKDSYE